MTDEYMQKYFQEYRKQQTVVAPSQVIAWYEEFFGFLFPEYSNNAIDDYRSFQAYFINLKSSLKGIIKQGGFEKAEHLSDRFFQQFPELKSKTEGDLQARVESDPSAHSATETKLTSLSYYAIVSHRVAHLFHQLGLHYISKVIAEYSHGKTGIDIHPAAVIGERFVIDHGTGVVVGETTHIGNNVTLYHGVTLGAIKVDKALSDQKRHPTIEDDVTIYANATVLGGETIVGKGSVVGSNTWVYQSVAANSKILNKTRNQNDNEPHRISRQYTYSETEPSPFQPSSSYLRQVGE